MDQRLYRGANKCQSMTKRLCSKPTLHSWSFLNVLIEQTTKELTKVVRTKFETLITIHVHQRDIFDDLCRMHIKTPSDFESAQTNRFYFNDDTDKCSVSITDVDFNYYRTNSLAAQKDLSYTADRSLLHYSGPGPCYVYGWRTGWTGWNWKKQRPLKTWQEALGKYVVVIQLLGSDGLQRTGANFQRIGPQKSGQLGAVLTSFTRIRTCLCSISGCTADLTLCFMCKKERKKQFICSDGDVVQTWNPEFRTLVAAKRIGVSGGTVGRKHNCNEEFSGIWNLSKLIDEDEPLFLSLINDLFPGIVLDKAGYPELEQAIANQVEEAGLINHPPWRLKLIQLFETQRVRHGMMVLGPSGAGKTACIHLLMKAMTDCGTPHREMRMNPKAITAPQMFGRLDVATNDWTDGIFSTLWRKTLRAKKGERIWIVLDGPVDAIWIENLNSVLDDNKTLTLANGDRIPMSPQCKIIFEPHNIDNASPATVSRNGMVYMSSSGLDWRPLLQAWLNKRPEPEAEVLKGLFDKSYDEILRFVQENCVTKMDILEHNYIVQ
ncbi:hypothetical protein OS493_040275, partial [Desmophyllum pertusum]